MEQLGIEPSLLIAQIVNFLIIVVVLTKILYKPIIRMLEKRRKEIEDGLALTEKMRKEEEALLEKRTKMIEEARKDARAIIEEGKKHGREAEKEIISEANTEANEIVAKSKGEIDRMRQKLSHEMKAYAVELAVAMAKRVLASFLTSKDQHKLLEKHIAELRNTRK